MSVELISHQIQELPFQAQTQEVLQGTLLGVVWVEFGQYLLNCHYEPFLS
jgi:hypothetical protein